MSPPSPPEYVFLDTEVYRRHKLDFSSSSFRSLVSLTRNHRVTLLITTVTKGEIEGYISELAGEIAKAIKGVRSELRLFSQLFPPCHIGELLEVKREAITTKLRAEFEKFLLDTGATEVGLDGVSPEAVFADYFAVRPPFREGKKKSEFPDAFALAALRAWMVNRPGRELITVGNDSDWGESCVGAPGQRHFKELPELLEHFADDVALARLYDAFRPKLPELAKGVAEDVEMLPFTTGQDVRDGVVDYVSIKDVVATELRVVELDDFHAVVQIQFKMQLTAHVSAGDPDWREWESETSSFTYPVRLFGTVSRDRFLTAEATLGFPKQKPEQYALRKLIYDDQPIELGVEEDELTNGSFEGNDLL